MEGFSVLSGIIYNIASSLAFIVGGVWVYWKFIHMRIGVWNLNMVVTPEAIVYNKDLRVLKINITLRNDGNTKISPGVKGCRVTVRELDKKVGEGQILELEEGKAILTDSDVLRRYKRPKLGYKCYVIEPQCEYHEVECIVVPKGENLSIRTEFFWKDNKDSIVEYSVFHVEE